MAKNAFLTKLQIEQDQKIRLVGNTMSQWSTQIAMDALVKTLGYGDCMKKDPWGEQRILAFAKEWAANVDEIWGGLTRQPDADAIRQQTDKLIEKKIPSMYGPWESRYIMWKNQTLASEVANCRGLWKRQGLLDDDGGTSELLRGVSDETK